jgi:zinc transporter ZupT
VDIQQRNALASLAIRLQEDMFAIGLVFFAFTCLALGYLIIRSGFLPRLIGILMLVAAGAYLLNSFAHILSPSLAAQLVPGIFAPIFFAELSLALWLTVKGVDREKWHARAVAAGVG